MTLEPLKMTCTSTRCDDGLHCYRQKRRTPKGVSGPCRTCGADLVDWSRVHVRDLNDVANTFDAMRTELVRHEYWHKDIDDEAKNHALDTGWTKLLIDIDKRLRSKLAPAKHKIYRDGMQTPLDGKAIYYAQHATATCCRTCLEEWHGVPRDRDMTEEEIGYAAELIRLYIADRLPEITEDGKGSSSKRRSSKPKNADAPAQPLTERQKINAALEAKRQRRSRDAEY